MGQRSRLALRCTQVKLTRRQLFPRAGRGYKPNDGSLACSLSDGNRVPVDTAGADGAKRGLARDGGDWISEVRVLEGLFGGAEFLNAALDGLTVRSGAIADNLANVDTPRYKAKRVEFESQLQRVQQQLVGGGGPDLAASDPRHFRLGPSSLTDFKPTEWSSNDTTIRNDDNNVDVDYEMTILAQTEISYNALSDLEKRDFTRLKAVINGQ